MITIRHERVSDTDARESLLDAALGPLRRTKASERLRERRLRLVAEEVTRHAELPVARVEEAWHGT